MRQENPRLAKLAYVTPKKQASKEAKREAKEKQARKENKNVNYMSLYYDNKY